MADLIDVLFSEKIPQEANSDALISAWEQSVLSMPGEFSDQLAKQTLSDSFRQFCTDIEPNSDLHILSGGWRVTVTPNLFKFAFSASFLAAALTASGVVSLPGYVLPAVISLMFDIEKIGLTPKEDYLLAQLKLSPKAAKGIQTPERLFAALDEDVRSQISYLDFLDFLEKLHLTGNTIPRGSDAFELSAKSRLRINFV